MEPDPVAAAAAVATADALAAQAAADIAAADVLAAEAAAAAALPTDLRRFLSAINSAPLPVILAQPRVGGTNLVGSWSGYGVNQQMRTPKTNLCVRELRGDPVKTFALRTSIQTQVQGGLNGKGLTSFCLQSEPNAGKGMTSLRHLFKLVPDFGLDGIFKIIQDDGSEINMLRTPGFVTSVLINRWQQDLTQDGVFVGDGIGGRHPVCPMDIENLEWSGNTLLNSCTELLSIYLQEALIAQGLDLNGLQVFLQIMNTCYRPSSAPVKKAQAALEAMDLKQFPGENVTLFVQQATLHLAEIKMNIQMVNQCPDLAQSALLGLTKGSDVYFQMEAKNKRKSARVDLSSLKASPVQVEKLLDEMEVEYLQLMDTHDYAPGEQKPAAGTPSMMGLMAAMQAQIQPLTQGAHATANT